MENIYYKVAGHSFLISTKNKDLVLSFLPSYASFQTKEEPGKLLFTLTIEKEKEIYGQEINRFEWDGSECVIYHGEEGYTFTLFPGSKGEAYVMRTNNCFSEVSLSLKGNDRIDAFVLNNFLMMTYAFSSASEKTLMIHASVIRNDGKGYLFLGKSGTGKSTHSNLWLNYIDGSDLLNDDNPIVRVQNGAVNVYGSPWSGKTPCYRNLEVPVKAFVKLRQAPENKIERLKPLVGFATILSSCSVMKWDKRVYDGICDTVSEVSMAVSVFQLDCLPDEAAARLSYNTIHV